MLQILSIQDRVWIGLSDRANEGTWVWVNGERARVPAAVLWIVDQPDDFRNNEDCGEVIADNVRAYGTNDVHCSRPQIGLCEKRYTL